MRCGRWFLWMAIGCCIGVVPSLRAEHSPLLNVFWGKSQEMLLREAQDGEVEAQVLLGHRAWGEGNAKEAAKWFRKAADGGDAEGQTALGKLLLEGKPGVPKNRCQALVWLEKAAKRGNAEAAEFLYRWFSEGKEVPRNPSRAFWWLSIWNRATEKRSDSEFLLGNCFLNGDGTDRNLWKARSHFQKALEEGHSLSPEEIDRLVRNVISVITARAEAGDPLDRWRLGQLYENGEIVEKSPEKAAHWYRLAAEQGDAEAMFALANLWAEQPSLAKSGESGQDWLAKAAAEGHVPARHRLIRQPEKVEDAFPFGSPILLMEPGSEAWFVCLKGLADYLSLVEKWKEDPETSELENLLPPGWRTGKTVILLGEFGRRTARFTSFRYLYDYEGLVGSLDIPREALKRELHGFCLNPDPRSGVNHRLVAGVRSLTIAVPALTGKKITRSFVEHVHRGVRQSAPRAEEQTFAAVDITRENLQVYRPRLRSPGHFLVSLKAVADPGMSEEDIQTLYLSALAVTDAAGHVLEFLEPPSISLAYNDMVSWMDIDGDGKDEILYNSRYYEGEYWFFSRWRNGAFQVVEIGGSGL